MKDKKEQDVSVFQVMLSVLAAMIGIQSYKNHERDFEHGNPIQYISFGILFVFIFVVSLIWIVNYILK